jgi:hypothetical protein
MKRLCRICKMPLATQAHPTTVVCIRCRNNARMRVYEARRRGRAA